MSFHHRSPLFKVSLRASVLHSDGLMGLLTNKRPLSRLKTKTKALMPPMKI